MEQFAEEKRPETEQPEEIRSLLQQARPAAPKRVSRLTTVLAVLFLAGVAYGAVLAADLDAETLKSMDSLTRGFLLGRAGESFRVAIIRGGAYAASGNVSLRVQRSGAAVFYCHFAVPWDRIGAFSGLLLREPGRAGDPFGGGNAASQRGVGGICADPGLPGSTADVGYLFPGDDIRGGDEPSNLSGVRF